MSTVGRSSTTKLRYLWEGPRGYNTWERGSQIVSGLIKARALQANFYYGVAVAAAAT